MYDEIINLAYKYGDILTSKAGGISDIGITKKNLTEDDIEIEKAFTKLINEFDSTHKVFAEEVNTEYEESENIWMIDPISNTFNYIRGIAHYAIVVSHLQKGELIFAMVYDPAVKELFTAYRGKGAFMNDKKIFSKSSDKDKCILYEYSSKIFDTQQGAQLFEQLSKLGRVKKSFGSVGLHYAYVACGRADAAVTINKDIFPEFAGKLILEEAGGKITDLNGRNISLDSVGIIASGKDQALYHSILNCFNSQYSNSAN